jgi:hypothetical protein
MTLHDAHVAHPLSQRRNVPLFAKIAFATSATCNSLSTASGYQYMYLTTCAVCVHRYHLAGALQTAGGDRYIAVIRGTDVGSDAASTPLTHGVRTPMQPVEAVVVAGLAGSGNYTATYNIPQVIVCANS